MDYDAMKQKLTNTFEQRLTSMMEEQAERDSSPHVPPDHIVSGECTLDALSRYLTIHPLSTIRAKEALLMGIWLRPIAEEMGEPWDLNDLLKPPQS